ncbi:MAG: GcrA family cell cycle regulator [Alphaproteobacteria bacterium]|nr:GcrA family cell cycle regulator [Alphaproteobacteria bacterium]
MSWSDDRVALLKRLWGEGKTAAEIAKELGGVTRNAVIGKAHRLKLSSRVSPIQQNKKKVRSNDSAPAAPRRPAKKVPIFKGKEVKMIDLTDKMCRWPNGDPQTEEFSFCGCQKMEGLPYCETHAQIAYQITSKARELNAKDFQSDAGSPDDLEIKTVSNG